MKELETGKLKEHCITCKHKKLHLTEAPCNTCSIVVTNFEDPPVDLLVSEAAVDVRVGLDKSLCCHCENYTLPYDSCPCRDCRIQLTQFTPKKGKV